jgi:hypothetical protein
MRWTWILTYIRLSTQRSLNVLLPGVEKVKWLQLELNTQETFSRLWSPKLRKIGLGFQEMYRFWSAKYVFSVNSGGNDRFLIVIPQNLREKGH